MTEFPNTATQDQVYAAVTMLEATIAKIDRWTKVDLPQKTSKSTLVQSQNQDQALPKLNPAPNTMTPAVDHVVSKPNPEISHRTSDEHNARQSSPSFRDRADHKSSREKRFSNNQRNYGAERHQSRVLLGPPHTHPNPSPRNVKLEPAHYINPRILVSRRIDKPPLPPPDSIAPPPPPPQESPPPPPQESLPPPPDTKSPKRKQTNEQSRAVTPKRSKSDSDSDMIDDD